MRGSKEEERLRGPMFPRAHVNDTEKGGPRAPPRNKMALYEQLSIPSQKLGSANNESSLVSSMSSSHAGTIERSVFNSFCNSPAPTHSENSFTPYSGGVEQRSKKSGEEQKPVKSPYDRSLSSTQPLPSSAKYNSFQSHNSNFKHFSRKKPADKVGIRTLSSAHSGPFQHYSSTGYSKDRKNQPYWNLSISMQYKNISEKQKSEIGITKLRPRDSLSNQTEESRKTSNHRDNKTLADASVSPSENVSSIKSLKRAHTSSNQEYSRGTVDSSRRLHFENDQSHQGFVAIEETTVDRDKSLLENGGGIGKNNASKVTNDSFSKSSPKIDKRSHIMIETEGRKHGSLQVIDVQRHYLSETCELNITPDDVVKVLGEKQFWKARKAITDQQRMFGVQVFELHRLMKVQKLIAEWPNLLLKDNIYLRKALSKSSPVRKVPSVQAKQQPPTIANSNDSFQKPYPIAESETNKELAEKSNNESHSHPGTANNTGPSPPWCVPAAGNHWLVPVMSPSEGLVFKPFSAPCHPNTGGYMPPVYSNCAPPPGRGDFLNAVYGVPASHQQGLGMTYFPPYGLPMMASSISGSAVEQSSCNMSSQMSRTIVRRDRNVQVSKESEIQGSTGSSLPPRPNGRALPLFPTEPTMSLSSDQNAQSKEQQIHAIKVVPHNRKLGNESAARIFQSITEEKRKQCC